MRLIRPPAALALAMAISFTIFSWQPSEVRAQSSGPVQTLRYDLPTAPLFIFNLEILQDFFFPAQPAEIVKTRFHLVFNTETTAGSFPAQDIALELGPPIPSPIPGDPSLLTEVFTGSADFGWSGAGTFMYDAETDVLNGVAIPAPPGSDALLYSIRTFNARRLTNPGDLTPLGGQFIDSWIEVDYVVIPEPGASAAAVLLAGLFRRRRSGGSPRARGSGGSAALHVS